ncbi:conserved hypothetical protein [uncultured Paludibacter sp.]|nr:conserved hypothetical protein [uncultured Paludibacter sp.]
MKFEGIPIFKLNFGYFKHGAAVTIPWLGIFVGKGYENDIDLLRHEFGHILQFRKWGFWLFWKNIAVDSLKSAKNSRKHLVNHQNTWTEWSANRLAYNYFGKPANWNFMAFPISPIAENHLSQPKFTIDKEDFIKNWLES